MTTGKETGLFDHEQHAQRRIGQVIQQSVAIDEWLEEPLGNDNSKKAPIDIEIDSSIFPGGWLQPREKQAQIFKGCDKENNN